jgi:hypothetical protein
VAARRRRRREEDTERAVRAELRQPWRLTAPELEGIAQRAHDKIEAMAMKAGNVVGPWAMAANLLFVDPEVLALANGFWLVSEPHAGQCGQQGLIPGVLYIAATTKELKRALRILHELAHALLRSQGAGRYTHADTWALTIMLAIPRRSFRHLELARHVPAWVRKLRKALAGVAERLAA